jgi:hypothetical protein
MGVPPRAAITVPSGLLIIVVKSPPDEITVTGTLEDPRAARAVFPSYQRYAPTD